MSQTTGKEKEKKLNRSKSSSELSNKVSKTIVSDPDNKLSPVSPKKPSSRSRVGSVDEHNKNAVKRKKSLDSLSSLLTDTEEAEIALLNLSLNLPKEKKSEHRKGSESERSENMKSDRSEILKSDRSENMKSDRSEKIDKRSNREGGKKDKRRSRQSSQDSHSNNSNEANFLEHIYSSSEKRKSGNPITSPNSKKKYEEVTERNLDIGLSLLADFSSSDSDSQKALTPSSENENATVSSSELKVNHVPITSNDKSTTTQVSNKFDNENNNDNLIEGLSVTSSKIPTIVTQKEQDDIKLRTIELSTSSQISPETDMNNMNHNKTTSEGENSEKVEKNHRNSNPEGQRPARKISKRYDVEKRSHSVPKEATGHLSVSGDNIPIDPTIKESSSLGEKPTREKPPRKVSRRFTVQNDNFEPGAIGIVSPRDTPRETPRERTSPRETPRERTSPRTSPRLSPRDKLSPDFNLDRSSVDETQQTQSQTQSQPKNRPGRRVSSNQSSSAKFASLQLNKISNSEDSTTTENVKKVKENSRGSSSLFRKEKTTGSQVDHHASDSPKGDKLMLKRSISFESNSLNSPTTPPSIDLLEEGKSSSTNLVKSNPNFGPNINININEKLIPSSKPLKSSPKFSSTPSHPIREGFIQGLRGSQSMQTINLSKNSPKQNKNDDALASPRRSEQEQKTLPTTGIFPLKSKKAERRTTHEVSRPASDNLTGKSLQPGTKLKNRCSENNNRFKRIDQDFKRASGANHDSVLVYQIQTKLKEKDINVSSKFINLFVERCGHNPDFIYKTINSHFEWMNSEGYNVTDENPVSFQQLLKAHTFYHPNKVNIAVSKYAGYDPDLFFDNEGRITIFIQQKYVHARKDIDSSQYRAVLFWWAYDLISRTPLETLLKGLCFVIDMKGSTFENYNFIRDDQLALFSIMEQFPLRISKTIIVNSNYFTDCIQDFLISLFTKSSLRNVSYVSQSELANYFPPEIIPSYLGGQWNYSYDDSWSIDAPSFLQQPSLIEDWLNNCRRSPPLGTNLFC